MAAKISEKKETDFLKKELKAFLYYSSNCLKYIAENTARAVSGGKYTEKTLDDILGRNRQEQTYDDPMEEAKKRLRNSGIEVIEHD